jgi:peptide/nickel transport system substrate-binding protein/oligopeptide transport system substrate-binding protein
MVINMRRKMALFLVIVFVFSTMALSACSTKKAGTNTDKNGTTGTKTEKQLAVEIGPDPETIDPALNSAVDGGNMILYTHECLLTIDQKNQIAPGQAESYDVSDDGLTWTFHLRDGLKWSDGSPLTAKDFVYSWKRVCDPLVAAPYAETVLSMVKGYDEAIKGNLDALGVTAPDDKTFVVELSKNCPYFASIAAFATLSPVQQATIEANGDAWATQAQTYIGNGSFYISEWVPGSHIIMKKNPNYWNAGAIKLDSIKFVLMEDTNASYSAYKSGEVQMIKDVPTEEIPSLTGNSEFHIEPIIGTYYISLNDSIEPFKNSLVRKALSLAIDREYVASTLMQGTYTPASNFMGPGWLDTDGSSFMEKANGGKPYIDTKNFKANLEEAKKLLADAGYPGGKGFPTITYSTNEAGYHKVVAEYLQQAWAELGITLDVEIVEWSSFTPMRRAGEYQSSRNGWVGDYSDPSNMLDVMVSTNGNNDGKYNNPDYDAAMEASRNTTDPVERSKQLHKAEDILMEDAACIPLAYYNDFYLQSSKITGSWHSPYGYWFFMYADIAE